MADKQAAVTYLADGVFVAEMNGQHVFIDNGGGHGADGRASYAAGPMDLMLAAIAGCTAIDVVDILKKARQPFTKLTVHASGERAADHPRRYTSVTLTYEVHGDVDPKVVDRAVHLSDEKYCSVSATFKLPCEVKTVVRIVANGGGEGAAG